MDYKKKGVGTQVYDYPVELVWSCFTSKSDTPVEPLDEETFNNMEPGPDTVFTRSLEMRTNELFSFILKSRFYTALWSTSLEVLGPCSTKVTVEETVTFKDMKAYLRCGMGRGIRGEIRYFLDDLDKKLDERYGKKQKKKK